MLGVWQNLPAVYQVVSVKLPEQIGAEKRRDFRREQIDRIAADLRVAAFGVA